MSWTLSCGAVLEAPPNYFFALEVNFPKWSHKRQNILFYDKPFFNKEFPFWGLNLWTAQRIGKGCRETKCGPESKKLENLWRMSVTSFPSQAMFTH